MKRTGRGGDPPAAADPARSGQAIVELTVALVAVMVLVAALLQIGTLSRVHLDTINNAREEAAMFAVASQYGSVIPGPAYLATWTAGLDGATYSRDDAPVSGNAQGIRDTVLDTARPGALAALRPGNAVSEAAFQSPLVQHFDLVHGRDTSPPQALLPVVRSLLYRRDIITLDADAWMVWTQGIY